MKLKRVIVSIDELRCHAISLIIWNSRCIFHVKFKSPKLCAYLVYLLGYQSPIYLAS